MTRVLAVGAGSFLCRAFKHASVLEVTALSHASFQSCDPTSFDVVINFGLHPAYAGSVYDPKIDADLAVARRAADAGRPFVMLSSRKVYGPGIGGPFLESDPLRPDSHYGTNKARTEEAVVGLNKNTTILRLANIFGDEYGRATFIGMAVTSLRLRNKICLDVGVRTRRDFLPVRAFVDAADALLPNLAPGVYNLGSGGGTAVGDVASALVEGYGDGAIIYTSRLERDAFYLDISRLKFLIGSAFASADILGECRLIGERLRVA